jgi:hypothetical protein
MPPDAPPLPLNVIAGETERDLILAAANRLSLCLSDGAAPGWPIRIQFVGPDAPLPQEPAMATLVSLAIETGSASAPSDAVASAWQHRAERWSASGAPVLLLNLFRYVADPAERRALSSQLRRLNLLAIELSRTTGAAIVDIDRAFALIGGRTLDTDYRCRGDFAIAVAAQAIVAALLPCLDVWVPPDRLHAATQLNGGREALAAIAARYAKDKA